MIELFGGTWSRTELAERTGGLAQVAGVELLELADGPERGVRVLEFRTGSGLSFQVALERGFDLLAAAYRGIPIGWRSPVGPRHPALASVEESRGWGFLRSFTGLLATCGLDHALAPATSSAAVYVYPGIAARDYPLHGRVSQIPARLLGYGERWHGDACTLYAEGEVAQMAVFGESLVLTRRIEAALGGIGISITDRVENRGFRPTPHMLLYHYNFGFPLLDEGAELLLPSRGVVHAVHQDLRAQGVGYRIQGAPKPDFREQVYEHDIVAGPRGMAPTALINPKLGERGFGIRLDYDRAALPCLIQWQCLQSGLYVLGIEPSTNHVQGRAFAEQRGELIHLEHGEVREYRTRLAVLDGEAAITGVRREIEALQPPPPDFAPPTGIFEKLGGRK
jgi:Domain of unknown function (DUF4432)